MINKKITNALRRLFNFLVSQYKMRIEMPNVLKKIWQLYFKGDYLAAKELLHRTFSGHVTAYETLYLLGSIQYKLNQFSEAQHTVSCALDHHPDDIKLLELLDLITSVTDSPVIISGRLLNPSELTSELSPLVSITIATYNQVKYIRECIESVLTQTYSPLEIIIGDDASNDGTVNIIEECLKNYTGPHKVSLVKHNENLGGQGSGNWRDLYRRTRGEFVIQFCGDDVMYPQMTGAMVSNWLKTGAMMVVANAEYIDDHSRSNGQFRISVEAIPNSSLDTLARDGANDCVFAAGTGYDRRFFQAFPASTNSPPSILGTVDIIYPFYAHLMSGCSVLAEPLMKYRLHGMQSSLSTTLAYESDAQHKYIIEERMWLGHLAHSLLMSKILEQVVGLDSVRFLPVKQHLEPLLAHQTYLMASRLVNVRRQLFDSFGIRQISTVV